MTAPLFPHIVDLGSNTPLPAARVPGPRGAWRFVVGFALGGCAIALSIAAVRHLVADSRPPARQIARVALLPDSPPPPPPPKVERKEEPKPEQRPQPQEKQPRPETPPTPAPLKMEGAAGNGPSAFAAGAVTKDYQGGPPVIGGTGGETGVDRAQQRLYANAVRQALHDEMERQLGPDAPDVETQVALWIGTDGRISRWELQGPRARDVDLDQTLQRCAQALQFPPPQTVPQPMRFRVSLRASG
jgi:outer membrane biosynthesis protein TonB